MKCVIALWVRVYIIRIVACSSPSHEIANQTDRTMCGFCVFQYTVNDDRGASMGNLKDLPIMETEWRWVHTSHLMQIGALHGMVLGDVSIHVHGLRVRPFIAISISCSRQLVCPQGVDLKDFCGSSSSFPLRPHCSICMSINLCTWGVHSG